MQKGPNDSQSRFIGHEFERVGGQFELFDTWVTKYLRSHADNRITVRSGLALQFISVNFTPQQSSMIMRSGVQPIPVEGSS